MSRAVVIANPTKFADLDEVRRSIERAAADAGLPGPRLVETTEDDPGFGQARAAIAAGASVVCALGGDGTVRAVAHELVGTGVALGLLPGGTGNLLARNVGAPVDDLAEAVVVALRGRDRVIDVGWLVLEPTPAQREENQPAPADNVHCFTVMAGIGFDAQVMADAPEGVKEKLGWAAYVASGGRHLTDTGFKLEVVVNGQQESFEDARTAVVGNCGELTGGMVLLPDALIDDGVLDLAVLTPTSLAAWLDVAARVIVERDHEGRSIDRRRGHTITLRSDPAQLTEVDGDVLSEAAELRLVVQPGCLTVRVPG